MTHPTNHSLEDDLLDKVPEAVLHIARRLRERGKNSWIVGGCVRDLLRGAEPKDWDLATSARPEEVKRAFPKVIATGIAHGTVTVLQGGEQYEVTTLRGEGAYTDGRRPDSVDFVDDIEADLARRDFTVNAIAIDPTTGNIVDPWGGRADLRARVLRAVGEPRERFGEDGLRVLRAARFASTLEFTIDPDTERAMGEPRSIETFRRVSSERVRDEWLKAMRATRPSVTFDAIRRTGILAVTCPELIESVDCAQNKYHAFDVWGHTMACVDAMDPEPILRVAALLHDVGKPRTRELSEKTSDYTFYNHERVGAEMSEVILTRLKFSNDERVKIANLVRHHLICYEPTWSDAAVRRWLRRVGVALSRDLLRLGRADARGKGRDIEDDLARLDALEKRAEAILAKGEALAVRDLAVRGDDLMRELGMKPGRAIGDTLTRLLEIVTEDPEKNDREVLLAEVRRMSSEAR